MSIWRLALLLVTAAIALTGESPAVRRVWADPDTNLLGGPSPDGRLLSYVDAATGDLAVLEVATGQRRRLTNNPPLSGQFAYFSAISRDGARVAYAWFNEDKFYELRVIGIEGGEHSTLFRNEEAGFVQPCAWSPDGKQILTLLFRKDNVSQIALVDASAPRSFRVLKTLNWVYPNKMDISPDGGYVVYDNPSSDDSKERDIFALSVDGSRETPLVTGPANDIFPVWARDGKSVVFVSDRGGSFGIWSQRVRDGKPVDEPVLLKAHAGRVLSLGMTPQGSYFFGSRSGTTDVRIAQIDLAAGKLAAGPQKAVVSLDGVTSAPAWSADGRKLAFLVRLANENFGQESRGIGVVELGSTRVQVLTPKLAHIGKLEWAPDGKSLLVSGSDRQSRRGLYRVDAAIGEATPVVHERSSTYRGLDGVWFSKGESILYAAAGPEGVEVRERPVSGTEETTLFRAEPGVAISHMTLSRDGRWLAFVTGSGAAGARDEVRALDLKQIQERTIASLPSGGVLGLQWTPDAKAVLVSTPGNPTAALWRAALDGPQPQRLEIRLDRRDGISLHPDGKRVAFTTGQLGSEVWVMDLP